MPSLRSSFKALAGEEIRAHTWALILGAGDRAGSLGIETPSPSQDDSVLRCPRTGPRARRVLGVLGMMLVRSLAQACGRVVNAEDSTESAPLGVILASPMEPGGGV